MPSPLPRVSPLAGKAADPSSLVNTPRLVAAYYTERPDASVPEQRVRFGTSGHRGSSFTCTFNEWHVLAISQAICRYRKARAIDGPLFVVAGVRLAKERGWKVAARSGGQPFLVGSPDPDPGISGHASTASVS